nr:hypothetical protein [Tanacetum cinerariifolium]
MANDEAPTNMALMAFSDSENEVMFYDQITVLKRDALFRDLKINALNLQIEKLKKEKESNQIKIDNFKNASKSLDTLIGSQISNNNRTGLRFTSYNVVAPPPTGLFVPPTIDLSNSSLEEFQHPEFKRYGPKDSKSVSVDTSNEIKKAPDARIIKDWVSDSDDDESKVMVLKFDNVQHKPEQANQPRKVSQTSRNNITIWNEIRTQKLGVGFQFTKKACFVCGSFSHLIKDLILTKSGIVSISTARQSSSRAATPVSAAMPINTNAPKSLVNVAKPRQNALQKSHSLSKRPFSQQTALKNRYLNNKVNTAKGDLQDALKDQGYFNSGCSMHMTKNISYLTNFRSMMKGMLPLGDEQKVVRLLAKAQSELPVFFMLVFTNTKMVINSPRLTDKKELAIPWQTTTGKEFSNPLMFWNTASSKTINSVKQIHAIVDGKVVVISESLVRSDLLFDDEDGTPAQTRSERVLEQPNEPPISKGYTSGSGEGRMEQPFELMNTVPPTPHDLPLTGGYTSGSNEGRLKLLKLMNTCTTLSNRVTTLENKLSSTKAVYHKSFITLTKRVKKLKTQLKQKRSREVIHSLDEKEPSLDAEDSPKHGRMLREIDKDETINLVNEQREVQKTAEPLKDDDDDATLAETLLNVKRSTSKDKRKSIMQETELSRKIKKREIIQLSLDEELAQKLHAEELAKETTRQEQERYNLEKALELQRQLDQRKEDVDKESSKKQKLDEQTEEEVEAQADIDQEIEEMKLYVKIVPDEDIAIDAIPLATKPPVILEYKIVKKGKISTYHIIRADGSTKRYTLMIKLLENIDREDLKTIWKLVKDKHGNTRPEEDYERVLWGDIKVIYDQQPYSPFSPYYKGSPYPDVDNRLLVSLDHGISGLSIADSNQSPHAVHEHVQASDYPVGQCETFPTNQDSYNGSSSLNYNYGSEGIGKSNSSSVPENQSCEEEKNVELEITDERELNGEVSKITPVAHVPKVNGDIPSLDEASTDHQRLLDRLDTYNFVELPVEGDGNCQFRALSDQLHRSPEHHKSVRKKVVTQLKLNPKLYKGYVPMAYTDYLRKISKRGEWGDHVTLQAAADAYGVKILVLTSFKDTIFIEILPKVLKSRRVFFLSYWAKVHYNSMYPKAGKEQEEEIVVEVLKQGIGVSRLKR